MLIKLTLLDQRCVFTELEILVILKELVFNSFYRLILTFFLKVNSGLLPPNYWSDDGKYINRQSGDYWGSGIYFSPKIELSHCYAYGDSKGYCKMYVTCNSMFSIQLGLYH